MALECNMVHKIGPNVDYLLRSTFYMYNSEFS